MPQYKKTYIPRGNSNQEVYTRRAIIMERLTALIGTGVDCAAFPGRKVEFIFDSIDETATRASYTYQSTLAALQVVKALKDARKIRTSQPESQKQKKMKFQRVFELTSELPQVGKVKIIVGERSNQRILHYCITKK